MLVVKAEQTETLNKLDKLKGGLTHSYDKGRPLVYVKIPAAQRNWAQVRTQPEMMRVTKTKLKPGWTELRAWPTWRGSPSIMETVRNMGSVL